jgi:ribosomal protein L21E
MMKSAPKTKAGKMKKVSKVMKEFKTGSLHSGKGGKVVKSPKQAIAIALSEAGMAKKKGK